jgi:ribulose-5-phosphate 4-epimerase/fuculose-1-phosphate aldolase
MRTLYSPIGVFRTGNLGKATHCKYNVKKLFIWRKHMNKIVEGRPALDLGDRESIYQPENKDLIFPQKPTFDNFAQERAHLKERLVAACRAFALEKFDYGFAGHLTVRDPEFPHLYWTNPMAVHFRQVKVSNLILTDHEGNVIEGKHALNRAGFVLHAAVHEKHPDIVAMCHAHTVYGTTFASLAKPLDPISQDAAAFYEDHMVLSEQAGQVAVENDAGKIIAGSLEKVKAIIHRNHGLFTVSRHSIEAAAFWFIALERVCKQQLAAEASGSKPSFLTPEAARYSREHVGSEYIGWLHFQPIWGYLKEYQPDMFD